MVAVSRNALRQAAAMMRRCVAGVRGRLSCNVLCLLAMSMSYWRTPKRDQDRTVERRRRQHGAKSHPRTSQGSVPNTL
jgi:hypothetical protein